MTIEQYVQNTAATIVYPETVESDYLVHGLVDEAGELHEILYYGAELEPEFDVIADASQSFYVAPDQKKVMHEAGDVMWYLARLVKTEDYNVDFQRCQAGLKNVKQRIEETAEEEAPILAGEFATSVFLLASKFGGLHKKALRGDGDKTQEKEAIIHEIVRGLYVVSLAVGYEFEDMMQSNIDKLMSRKQRGVIAGNGSQR